MLAPWKKSHDKPRQCVKKQRYHFADKSLYSQSYGFSSSHVWMWELDHKENWVPKNWCFWTVVLQKTLESPLDCKEIKPIHPEGNASWIIHCKDWWWSWSFNTLAKWWKSLLIGGGGPSCWERLKAWEEGDNTGWDGWMASLTRWTWVSANSRRWLKTRKPGVLQSMQSVRVRHNWVWATINQNNIIYSITLYK